MKVAISNRPGDFHTTGNKPWFVREHHEVLLRTLRQAAGRSDEQARSVLASFTCPLERHDALRAFSGARRSGLGECFFWERPVEQHAIVGAGVATVIETAGTAYLTSAASAWRALMQDAVITTVASHAGPASSGPVLFGGFSFDPLAPRTQLWTGFPDGLLILPRILLSYSADSVTLTVNRIMQASDDVERCAREIEADVERLQSAVERTQSAAGEDTEREVAFHEILLASEWMAMVAGIVDMIRQGAFEKVVLAREISVRQPGAEEAFDIDATLRRLRESYPGACVFAIQRGERFFAGATPERLVQAQDGRIQTMALAGSARRGATPEEDAAIGTELLRSKKNNGEHAIVVAMVREALEQHCTHVQVSDVPELLKLKNVQHLKTSIAGELLPGRSILDIVARLHPTPAVGGFPRQAALEAIRHTEKLDRGWYAAPLGWIGTSGHGEFAVALRSALIDVSEARLFAGCGIVADSDPQVELAESWLKFQVMLRALGNRK